MEWLLTLQAWLWVLVLPLALLAAWALRQATRHSTRLRGRELPLRMQQLTHHRAHGEPQERTMVRWSRIVKKSNTAFWTYVSQRQDPKQ
ncbi:MAG: hypothetical protein JO171_05465 [Paludibacterium sp.]|uniref:hypothetical protein n=1 Tax=Paludibacterium sp. TaxID=1917523 RepID=UPI0025E22F11|nr:hypothetical protein [Paludibacterium sp.]MBV8046577.1 hypothetical protein [Paludibacterium sp.]MBV8647048.1 hypothetical protein [Paludibacterium sp.]